MELSISKSTTLSKEQSEVSFRNSIIEFWGFIKKVHYIEQNQTMSLGQKIKFVSNLMLFKLALLPIILPIVVATKLITGAKSQQWDENWMTYFIVIILAPFIEELIFQGFLKYSRVFIAFTLSFLLMIVTKFIFVSSVVLGISIVLNILLVPLYVRVLRPFDAKLSMFWSKSFPYIFHITCVCFGLIHLTNYTGISNNYFLAIPLVTMQLISGYILGFVRMKFGLIYSIGVHSTWNFIVSFGFLFELLSKFL